MDQEVVALRKRTGAILRLALAGEVTRRDLPWPPTDADESVLTATIAVDEYLSGREHGGFNDDDWDYWTNELTRMATRLDEGQPLDGDQLSGWRSIDLKWLIGLVAAIGVVVIVWRILS